MKFFYKDYGKSIFRPIIPITIIFKNRLVIYEVLVDSGADSNILPSEIAEILGIDFKKGNKNEVAGITGENRVVYFHNLDIRVGGNHFKDIQFGFMEEMGQFSHGVVGQKGFFDIFVVRFDLIKKENYSLITYPNPRTEWRSFFG